MVNKNCDQHSPVIVIAVLMKTSILISDQVLKEQGPVIQSIMSLTSSLRGQLVKCFMTLLPNTLIFFVEKMREAFALQKLLKFFQQKILASLHILTKR